MTSLMTTTTTTWSPTSNQLQFNFKFRKPPPVQLLFRQPRISISSVRVRVRVPVRVLYAAQDDGVKSGNVSEPERRRNEDSWNGSSTTGDANLSDWFGDSEKGDSQRGIGGVLGIGLAGVFLFAGITFAAMSIGKRSSPRPTQEMKPLTEQHQEMLTSGEEPCKEADGKNDMNNNVEDERNFQSEHYLESKTDVERISESEKSTSDGLGASIQEHLHSESVLHDVNSPDTVLTSSELPEAGTVDGVTAASSSIESQNLPAVSMAEENLGAAGVTNANSDSESFGTFDQQGLQVDAYNTALEPSDTVVSPVSADSQALDDLADAKLDMNLETQNVSTSDTAVVASISSREDGELTKSFEAGESKGTPLDSSSSKEDEFSGVASSIAQLSSDKQDPDAQSDTISGSSVFESNAPTNIFSSRGIPAPSLLSAALQAPPGKVLVPAVTDQTQGQALAALQVLKVIESDAKPGDLCTRREYARWLVSASSALSRNSISKVYPAMYIENATELAYDDITPEDPDFTSIQGLAEAGLIASKLSRRDLLSSPEEDIGSFYFHADSPLSRQDLVTWKLALEKRQLPEADRKILHQLSGFIDIDKIDPDAWPALMADVSAGEHGIVALAFGYTRLFQPDKPVTKGQAAIALATGEAADIVSEELARIEAESIAENAVAAHTALVAEVEKDINASFEKELLMEREKIDAVQKMAEDAKKEVERLRGEREEQNSALMKERAAVESEMEVLSRLRHELEEQLQSLMSNKVEISYEKERIEKLRKETEEENQAISRLQYELEVERKALSMARAWAEDEAKRVQEYAKSLEEVRDRWERKGIKVVVDENLREEASAEVTWTNVGKKLSAEETVGRAESLTHKLKVMAGTVEGKSKEMINKIVEKLQLLISGLKEWISEAGRKTTEMRNIANVSGSVQQMQQRAADMKEGARRAVEDCREGLEKLSQRFRT